MSKIRLGVNIDHVATIRNARGDIHPNPLTAARLVEKFGADSITIHLREDRRHIRDQDLKNIISKIKIPVNLEIAATNEMMKIAKKNKPKYICLVPERREEITTEGGLNLNYKRLFLKKYIEKLKKNNFRVSLFIEPNEKDILDSKFYFGADCVEIHTGKLCNLINRKLNFKKELNKIKYAAFLGYNIGLDVHAGHGLNFKSAKILSKIRNISEFNIGHFLIGESIFIGLEKTLKTFKKIIA